MNHKGDIEQQVETITQSIKNAKKYRSIYIGTIRQIVKQMLTQYPKPKIAEKAARKHLHKIVASYLGDPEYARLKIELDQAAKQGNDELIRDICIRAMRCHRSTEERLPILAQFYEKIFQITGTPERILDIACGLNPLAVPWMGLPKTTRYYAYDIHEQRIDFLNLFLSTQQLPPLAIVQDIAYERPQEEADVAFFFKELHRYEQSYGQSLALLESLRARYLVVSLPTVSVPGNRSLVAHYRKFFKQILAGKDWPVQEILFESELVFCVEKTVQYVECG